MSKIYEDRDASTSQQLEVGYIDDDNGLDAVAFVYVNEEHLIWLSASQALRLAEQLLKIVRKAS